MQFAKNGLDQWVSPQFEIWNGSQPVFALCIEPALFAFGQTPFGRDRVDHHQSSSLWVVDFCCFVPYQFDICQLIWKYAQFH